MPITEMNICQWADYHDCRSRLPVLIRRLIRETVSDLSWLRFPGNEAVDLAGLDGQVEATTPTSMVPQGRSVWEMGCNQNPKIKANSDYTKRTAETPQVERLESSFVFVTPRRWNEKDVWLQERRQEKSWAGVYAYDAIDLEAWLEEAPVTSRWFGETLGIDSPGLLTPGEWWRRWATVTEPPLTMRLLTARRHNEQQTLLTQLKRNESIASVLADDRQEAVAFVVASMLEANDDELLDRTLVVTSAQARVPTGPSRLIIVADVPEGADPDFGDRRNITIVRTYPKGRFDADSELLLSHVPTEIFRAELESMGFSHDDAANKALQTGHSVPVLRRQLSRDPTIRRPVWAHGRASAKQVLPFALAGTWVEKSVFDDSTFLELLGELSSGDVGRIRDDLLMLNDAPIVKYGNITKVVSQLDALFAVGPFIEENDLDRFFLLAKELLGERDPALDIPQEQWWMAHVLGKAPSCSGGLLSGLGDALCILAVHGSAICGKRLGVDCAYRVGLVVRSLMHNADEDRWLSIRRHLREFSEAAPTVFLDCLEEELQKSDPPIRAIMGVTGGDATGECLRTDLLWALEMLAWHPEYFARAAQIALELCRFDIKDNWGNSPKETSKALFCAWLPATPLSISQKAAILRNLSKCNRAAVMDVCISLLPLSIGHMASQTVRPQWRYSDAEVPAPTHEEVGKAAVEASRLLLDLAPYNVPELKKILEAATRLHPDDLSRLVSEVQRWAVDADDDDKAELQNDVRRHGVMFAYQEHPDKAQVGAFQQMESALVPEALTARHRWLFESSHIEWLEIEEKVIAGKLSYEDSFACTQKRRQRAIVEIESHLGEEQVLQFSLSVKHPEYAAQALVPYNASPSIIAEWINRVIIEPSSEAKNAFFRQLLWDTRENDLYAIVACLNEKNILDTQEKRDYFVKNLPGNAYGWKIAEAMCDEFAAIYWKTVTIAIWKNMPAEEATYAIERLLSVQRPCAAFFAVHYFPDYIASEQWICILRGIVHGEEPEGRIPDAYHINTILAHLEATEEISDEQIAQLELPFLLRLCPYGIRNHKRPLAVHRVLARNPRLFIQLLSWLYRRRDQEAEPELEIEVVPFFWTAFVDL